MAFLLHWRGRMDTRPRRFLSWCLVSLALHAPLSPLAGLLGLASTLFLDSDPPEESVPLNAIPVDLFEDAVPPEPAPVPPNTAPPAEITALPAAKPKPKPRKAETVLDAGIDDAAVDGAAGVADAGAPDADLNGIADAGTGMDPEAGLLAAELADGGRAVADASLDRTAASADASVDLADAGVDAGGGDAGLPRVFRDPVALAGSAARLADRNAPVQLIVYTDRIRNHSSGKRVGRILAKLPQWNDFFGPTGLDPVQSIDRMLLAGPDFRDSSQLIVVIQHNVSDKQIRQAIDHLVVQSAGGEWLDAGIPAARAHADRAARVIVMPGPGLLVMAPPSAEASALALRRGVRLPNSSKGEALTGVLRKPYHAFRKARLRFQVPQSIQDLRFQVTPLSDGGAEGTFVARDSSPEEAQRSLMTMNQQLESLRGWGFLFLLLGGESAKLLSQLELRAEGSDIHGTLRASPAQVDSVLATLEGLLGIAQPKAPASASARRPSGAASSAR